MADTLLKEEELQTVTTAGRPVKDRVATVQAARNILQSLEDADIDESFRRNRIRGQIDGHPPWDPTMMQEKGLGYVTNMNFLELRAVLDDRAARRFSSYHEVPSLIRVRHNFKYDQTKPELPYSGIIEEEFTRLLREDWPGFDPLLDQVGRESDAYGIGVALFPDEWDWRPKAFPRSKFKADPRAGLDTDKLSIFCLDDEFTAGELFRAIEDPELAAEAGWNVALVRKLLISVYSDCEKSQDEAGNLQGNIWESIEQQYRNNSAMFQSREFDPVMVHHIIYVEVDSSKVTHKIFSKLETPGVDGFLFEAPDRYCAMTQALWLLPYNYGDGFMKSCRGVASYMEQHFDMSNRFLGRAMDAGMTAASLLVQPESAMSKDKLSVVRSGILTVIDPQLRMQQSNFQPKIGDILTLRRVSSDLVQNNTRESKDYNEDPESNNQPVSAAEIREKSSRTARGESQQTVFYAKHLQILYREMFRRVTNPDYILDETRQPGKELALVFIRRCVERGVPFELLLDNDKWRIMATKPIGGGSPQARAQALTNLMQSRGDFDERGRREILREFTAAQTSYEELDRFMPLQNRDEIDSNEHSIAALENGAFGSGIQIPAGSDQVHTIHFKSHAQQIVQMIKAVKEQGIEAVDPQRGMQYLSAALPNMEQHLQYLQRDDSRKAFVKEGVNILKQGMQLLETFKKYIQQQIQAQQEQAQQQQQQVHDSEQRALSAEAQVELAKAEMDAQVDMVKVESLNAMRAQKTAEQLRIKDEQNRQDADIKARKAQSDIAIAEAKALAEIEIKRQAGEAKKTPAAE